MLQTFHENIVNYIWCLYTREAQQMNQSEKKYIDLCQHANKYKQVVLEPYLKRLVVFRE